MVEGLNVFCVVAFFVSASLAAFLYIRFRWWHHVRSDATEVNASVNQREVAPPHDGGPDITDRVTLSYEFADQYYSPAEWFYVRKGQQFISIYVLAETPTKPILRQVMMEDQFSRCCFAVICATVALEMAVMSLVFVAQDDDSRRTLVLVLLATSYVVFAVFLCCLVRNRTWAMK